MRMNIVEPTSEVPPPGTVLLLDESQNPLENRHLKHGTGKHSNVVLVPQPSKDPNDPLLWSRWRKEAAFFTIFLNAIIFASCPGPLLSSSTFVLSGILHVPLGKISELGGYQLMVSGIVGPFVSVLAQKYGKRPQFVAAGVFGTLGTAICIAGAHQSSYSVLMAGRVVQGLGATAFESISLASVGDLYYLHERGRRMGLVVLTLACMSSVVSIISGVITHNLGWVYLFDISLPFNIVGLLGVILFLPETQFRRLVDSEQQPSDAEMQTKADETLVKAMQQQSDGAVLDKRISRQTYIHSLRIFTGTYSSAGFLKGFANIFMHLLNPAVVWILTTTGVIVSLFTGLAYILSQIWSVAPYSLNVQQCGYFFTGAFLGGILAVSGGPICDAVSRRMAHLNNGIYEPEFRIPVNLLAAAILALGWFVFMWNLDHPSPTGYYLGAFCHGCIVFGVTITSTTGSLYILDAFPQHATEIFILQMTTKNLLFFMFSKFINAWEVRVGGGHIMKVFGAITMALLATSIPMYSFGKLNRHMMRKFYARLNVD